MRVLVFGLALACLGAAATTLQDPAHNKMTSPTVGKPAPAFTLNDHSGHAVKVGGKTDRWTVLAFFPKAATPG